MKIAALAFRGGSAPDTTRMVRAGSRDRGVGDPFHRPLDGFALRRDGTPSTISPEPVSVPLTTVTGLPSTEPISMVRSSPGSSSVSAGANGGRLPKLQQQGNDEESCHYRFSDPISLSYFDMITSQR